MRNRYENLTLPLPRKAGGEGGDIRIIAPRQQFMLPVAMVLQLIVAFSFVLHERVEGRESLSIPMNPSVQRDPVVQWIGPRRDGVVDFRADGILVEQTSQDEHLVGVKSRFSLGGDFEVEFDFDVLRLEAPTKGDKQGLTLRFIFDTVKDPTLSFGYLANSKGEKEFVVNPGGMLKQKVKRFPAKEVRSVKLAVRRIGNEVSYTIKADSQLEFTGKVQVVDKEVRDFAVFALRQDTGNTKAGYILRRVEVTADRFPSYARQPPGSLSWWTILVVLQVTAVCVLLGWMLYRRLKKS